MSPKIVLAFLLCAGVVLGICSAQDQYQYDYEQQYYNPTAEYGYDQVYARHNQRPGPPLPKPVPAGPPISSPGNPIAASEEDMQPE